MDSKPRRLFFMLSFLGLVSLILGQEFRTQKHGCENDLTENINIFDAIKKEKNETFWANLINCITDEELERKDDDGETPILLAALYGNKAAYSWIQGRNVTFTGVNKLGGSLLHEAVLGGDVDILENVLERNEILLSRQDNDGNTALHLLAYGRARNNTLQLCEKLLEGGALTNVKNRHHMTPFHAAFNHYSNSTQDIIRLILNKRTEGYNTRDDTGRTPLQIALDNDNIGMFDLFINYSANPYYTDFNGRTVVHNAVLKDNGMAYLKTVLYSNRTFRGDANVIIPQKDGLNIRDHYGYTALHYAAEYGLQMAFDELFHQKGINVSTINQFEDTTLMSAVKGGAYSILEKLVAATRSFDNFINYTNKDGTSPLHLAVESGQYLMVQLLLNNFADPTKRDSNGLTPIDLAASSGPLDMIKLFSSFPYKVLELLALSVANGNDEAVIEYFLNDSSLENLAAPYQLSAAKGLDHQLISISLTNTTNKSNFSQILNLIISDHKSIWTEIAEEDENEPSLAPSLINIALFFQGKLSTIEILMNRSEDLSLHDTWSPANIAAFRNKLDIVEYFLDRNNSLLSHVDVKNQSIMHKAAWGGHNEIVQFLHKNKSEILLNKKDAIGRTPLHIAAMRGNSRTVECILQLDRKAINMGDKYQFTPLHLAEIYGHHKFFTALQYISITVPSSGRYRMKYPGVSNRKRNHTATIQLLLNQDADPNAQDSAFGWTTLHWAAANGDLQVVKMLVRNKGQNGKVNIPSHSDQTPLYLARFWGRLDVYEYLKANNAVW